MEKRTETFWNNICTIQSTLMQFCSFLDLNQLYMYQYILKIKISESFLEKTTDFRNDSDLFRILFFDGLQCRQLIVHYYHYDTLIKASIKVIITSILLVFVCKSIFSYYWYTSCHQKLQSTKEASFKFFENNDFHFNLIKIHITGNVNWQRCK